MSEQTSMVDMEQKLAADASGAYRDELLQSLAGERSALRRTMDAGLPPEEYEQASRLMAGVDAATRVVETLWKTVHR